MSAPPPYESEFEVLLSNLTALDITHPGDPDPDSSSARPQARASVSTPNSHGLYHYESPTKSGYTNNWDEAADATQGVAGTRPRLLTPKKKFRPRTKKTAYAVFFGRAPGVYSDWSQAKLQVDGAHGSIFQGYPSKEATAAAFEYAQRRSWTRVCNSRAPSPTGQFLVRPIAALPTPMELLDTPNPLHCDPRGTNSRWYVVYCGVTPGVYQSFLECSLNTVGLSCAIHESFPTKALADSH
ncbi:hypothetical protein C8R44DRAFT_872367 [Mycena epipterygia]|nr:hypothetical protein C8R44DRAFT_872367 [Mycena epipterygia]